MDPTENAPTTPVPLEVLSIEQVLELEQKFRENKEAELRGEPLPHQIDREDLRRAINSMRRQRGTVATGKEKKAKTSEVIQINLDDL